MNLSTTHIVLSGLLLVLAAGPAHSDGQRTPKGESSGSTASAPAAQPRTPQPRTAEPRSSSPPTRRAEPRSSSPPTRQAEPRSTSPQPQRRPQPEAQRTPRRDGGESGSRFYGGRGFRPGFGGFHGFWYPWSAWYPWGYWGGYSYYPYWGPGVRWYPEQVRQSMGALDTDVRPEEAEVWLNGQRIGIADNFDGWPRYLWLEEGTYDVVFYHEGFETLARQYTIYPGVVIDVEDRMRRGEAVHPLELVDRSTVNRDERLQRREERGEIPAGEAGEPEWRDRVERERVDRDAGAAYDARAEPGRLYLEVVPRDAAIYLDGRFLGTGEDLTGVHAGLIVDPGEHELEVVRPGYASRTVTFTSEPGEEVEVAVELEEGP
ncbi:MAG: PEGA domain-containing protein [Thermoanaerobaculia bacterium]